MKRSELDAAKRLDLNNDSLPGGTFARPEWRARVKSVRTAEKAWRHLNFFQHEAYLHVRTSRGPCERCGLLLGIPQGRNSSGFTLFRCCSRAFPLSLCRAMPVAAAARVVDEHDTRIWRVLHHYVDDARE